MLTREAEEITGGLSRPSKMPCMGYNLPATACNVGGKLRKHKNTVCSKCYACKGRYVFPNVRKSMERHLKAIEHPMWVEAMVTLISRSNSSGYFRWHDSGDIQNSAHLSKIIQIAEQLPKVKFWLPTKEYRLLCTYTGAIPANLVVRFSAPSIDKEASKLLQQKYCYSAVFVDEEVVNLGENFVECPALKYHTGKCGECRACWNKEIKGIFYKQH